MLKNNRTDLFKKLEENEKVITAKALLQWQKQLLKNVLLISRSEKNHESLRQIIGVRVPLQWIWRI